MRFGWKRLFHLLFWGNTQDLKSLTDLSRKPQAGIAKRCKTKDSLSCKQLLYDLCELKFHTAQATRGKQKKPNFIINTLACLSIYTRL
jgi:hypothetical protein